MPTIGEKLIQLLEAREVEVVFGIPGVHTIEHYRGLSNSKIRHVTPRHEQGAGFMADGYARVSGKPGVALVITGPGITNIITAIAQARADSVAMLVISAVNPVRTLGRNLGCLHEIPDQQATLETVALESFHIGSETDLSEAMDAAFEIFESKRPGPVHIEIPYDIAASTAAEAQLAVNRFAKPCTDKVDIDQAVKMLGAANKPLIIAGGGIKNRVKELTGLAELLNSPVVTTTNARGLMHGHELAVHASPSLNAVRSLIEEADVVSILGSEMGRTDYDMYATDTMPKFQSLIRADISKDQLETHQADLKIRGDAGDIAQRFIKELQNHQPTERHGVARARNARDAAFNEIGETMQEMSTILETMRDAVPNSIFVGDSTQAIYAGNLFYDHDRPGGWFNSSTGYGTLGFGIPAAIGASIATPGERVFCFTGDGGAQFSLPELMVAKDENLPVTFVIWNNFGYKEIEISMIADNVKPVGCDPSPPDFNYIAAAYNMPYFKTGLSAKEISKMLRKTKDETGPILYEIEF